jgi:hypothetical protein
VLAHRAGIAAMSVSMSHEQEYATATVVAWLARPSADEESLGRNVVHAGGSEGRLGQPSSDA